MYHFYRYKILASSEMAAIPDNKEAAQVCFDKSGLDPELYRLGHTKVYYHIFPLFPGK